MKNLRISLLLLILVCFPNIVLGQEKSERPYRFLIPDGYVGWVKIEFNIKDTVILQHEGDYSLIEIPSSGRFQTSSDDESGLARDEYYYVSSNGRRRLVSDIIVDDITMIWSGYSGSTVITNSKEKAYKYIYFFVGPKTEYEKYKCERPRDCIDADENGDPKLGNKKSDD